MTTTQMTKEELERNQAAIQEFKAEIEGTLGEVMPILEKSRQALDRLKMVDLCELKTYARPPQAVVDVMQGVLLVLGQKDLEWSGVMKLTGNTSQFLRSLQDFDVNSFKKVQRAKTEAHLAAKCTSFQEDVIRNVSTAGAAFTVWVQAQVMYSKVMEQLEPQIIRFREMEAELAEKLRRYDDQRSKEEKSGAKQIRSHAREEEEVATLNAAIEELRTEIDRVVPVLDEAREALAQVTKSDLTEMRSYMKPPPAVLDVMQGALLVLGEDDLTWARIKRETQNGAVFLRNLKEFDARNLTEDQRAKVEAHLAANGTSFQPEVITKVSRVGASVAVWVQAQVMYSKLLVMVQPRMDKHRELDAKLQKLRRLAVGGEETDAEPRQETE